MFILGVNSKNYLKSPTQYQWTSDSGQVVAGRVGALKIFYLFNLLFIPKERLDTQKNYFLDSLNTKVQKQFGHRGSKVMKQKQF